MKLVKKFVLPLLFVSALAVKTYAGDLETPGCVPPPPPSYSTSSTVTTDETTLDSTALSETTVDTSDELLYDALMAMLSLF